LAFDAMSLTGNECLEELEEVTQEIVGSEEKRLEEGDSDSNSSYSGRKSNYRGFCGISPIWVQTFVMTFGN
jgi:hypothetical protein